MAEARLVSVSDCINELRQELTYALASEEAGPLRFALGPVDMELSVVILPEHSGKGGVRLWVSSGGEVVSRGTTFQKIKLSLQPQQLLGQGISDPIIVEDGDDGPNGRADSPVAVSPTQISDELRNRLRSRYTVQPEDYS